MTSSLRYWPLACGLLLFPVSTALPQEPATDSANKSAEAPKTNSASKAATHRVEQEPFKVEVELDGVFAPASSEEVVLRPESWSSYKVLKAVEPGARVKKGQPLIWFETDKIDEQIRDLQFTLRLSELSLKQAEQELYQLEKTTPMDLELARRTHKQTSDDLKYFLEVERPYSEKSAARSLESAEHYLEYAQEELDQLEKMYKADDLTEETEEIILKRARRSVESAQFSLEATQMRTERLLGTTLPRQEESLLDSARRQDLLLQKTETTLPVQLNQKRIELDKQRHGREKSQEQLAKLEADREDFVVEAPAAGIVYYGQFQRGKWAGGASIEQQLRPGGTASPQTVLMTIVSPTPDTVRVEVAEKDLSHVRPGVTGKVLPTAFPDRRLPARVAEVSAVPIAAGKFDGHIQLAGKPEGIVPGMACKVKLTSYQKQDAIAVPSSTVFTDEWDDERQYVYLAKADGKHERRTVTVGKKNDKQTEIIKGLKPGDEILTKKPDDDD